MSQVEEQRAEWLRWMPHALEQVQRRWGLTLGERYSGASCAWVVAVTRADGSPAVLKIGFPHFEGRDEIAGLRFWDGDPTVRLLDADEELSAMLIERCDPGTPLRSLPECEQDVAIALLLRKLWRPAPVGHSFRSLAQMLKYWANETKRGGGLVGEGLRLFRELPASAKQTVMLATDLHAGNVLRAEREPWLVIDPKPFVGDPAYDATQHLLNCRERLRADASGTIARFADLLELDSERVRLWTFARAATDWSNGDSIALARALAF